MSRGIGTTADVRGARCSPLRLPTEPSATIAAHAARGDRPAAFARCHAGFHHALLAVTLLVAACSPTAQRSAEVVLSVGYAAPATGLETLIDRLTQEGLVRSGPDGRVEPMLAETWTVEEDGKAVSIALRPDVSFHDGSPMTADDVKSSLDRLRDNPARIARNPVLGDIASIVAPEPHQVVINLARPSAQLLLSQLGVRIDKLGPDDQPIGIGPFFVESATVDETTLRANPHYHQGQSEIDTVRIRAYSTLRTAWAAMMRSEIDFLYNVPIEAREFVEADSSVRVFSRDLPYAFALVFNTRRPPFDDRRVRVALSHAVDRQAIIDVTLRGHGSVASGIWPRHWVFDGVERMYAYDPTRADRLLSDIGYTRPASGDEGLTDGFPSRLRFELLVGVDQARFEPIALMLQKQLRQIGVDMALDAKPFEAVAAQVDGDSWDAALLPFNTARNLSRLYLYWHSSEPLAVSGFTGADDTLEALRSSVTEADIRASAREFQRLLFEESPAIFLTGLEEARAVSRRFVVPDAPGWDVMETLWRWRVAGGTSVP